MKAHSILTAWLIAFAWLLCTNTSFAAREKLGEAEFLGAKLAGDDIADWLDQMADKRPNSISVFSVVVQEPLDQRFSTVLETEVFKSIRSKLETIRVVTCPSCRKPQLRVVKDQIIITKGAPDIKTLQRLGRETNSESFLMLEAVRTSLSIMIIANLHQTSSGEVISSKTIRVPIISIAGAASQFLLTMGTGLAIGADSGSDSPPATAELFYLEEVGFGKAGIAAGAVVKSGVLSYLQPTFTLRGRIPSLNFYSHTAFGLGFGASNKGFGISARVGYRVFLGTFTSIGVQAVGMVPLSSRSGNAPDAFIGATIGFSLGR